MGRCLGGCLGGCSGPIFGAKKGGRAPSRAPSQAPSQAPSRAPHIGPALLQAPPGALFGVRGFGTSVAGQAIRNPRPEPAPGSNMGRESPSLVLCRTSYSLSTPGIILKRAASMIRIHYQDTVFVSKQGSHVVAGARESSTFGRTQFLIQLA